MTRYSTLFDDLNRKNEGAYVPFVSLGDPSPELSLSIIDSLIKGGADALELGIPFSDPMADGPTIQNANIRAFSSGINVEKCFDMLTHIRRQYAKIPIGLLVYANLVFKGGVGYFYKRCKNAGVDSVLIADIPVQYSGEFILEAEKNAISPIFICPPNADEALISNIAKHGMGYTYLVSRSGVTGADNQNKASLEHVITLLKKYSAPPIIQGFGISTPQQVRQVIQSGVSGAIAGSATIKIIEKNLHDHSNMLKEVIKFTQVMKSATKR